MAKKMTKKAIEGIAHDLFKRLASCVQFDIWDLTHVLGSAENALKLGGTIEEAEMAMVAAIAKYRKN